MNSPFVNHKGKEINSDRVTDHAQIHKGKMKEDDLEITISYNPKILDGGWGLALVEKI